MKLIVIIFTLLFLTNTTKGKAWGFYGHKLIAEWSIYALPEPLFSEYNLYIEAIKEKSIIPDIIKNTTPKEYCKHYIDLENTDSVNISSFNLDSCFNEISCYDNGILPYIINVEFNKLVTAFKNKDSKGILYYSGTLSHYVSDLCVPFHTTANYDGQLTNQEGIHALWESYLPEHFNNQIKLFGIKAHHIKDIDSRIMQELNHSHHLVNPILDKHMSCINELQDKSYGFFTRKGAVKKGYSEDFMNCFIEETKTDIEGQLVKSIQLTADLWLTAWVFAGKPKNIRLNNPNFKDFDEKQKVNSTINYNKRKHE